MKLLAPSAVSVLMDKVLALEVKKNVDVLMVEVIVTR